MHGREGEAKMVGAGNLRILTVGAESARKLSGELESAGHAVVAAADIVEATEALILQRFEAVLLTEETPKTEIAEFAAAVHELDLRTGQHGRTAILFMAPEGGDHETLQAVLRSGIDEVVADSTDADTLTLAIARLAAAVSADKGVSTTALAPELPVLQVEELMEQVAFDNELLLELIELYIGERARQSLEMKEALARSEWERLSRVAHTIKGSLGSLHAAASHATAQALEMSARAENATECEEFLLSFERQLDMLEEQLLALRRSLR